MAELDRRTFLRGATAVAGGALLGGPFAGYLAGPAAARSRRAGPPLGPVLDERGQVVRLWLPEGFHYRSFHDTAEPVTLDDGTLLPARHDGMAAFEASRRRVWLVRNHEVNGPGAAFGPGTPTTPWPEGGRPRSSSTGTATSSGRSPASTGPR